MKALAMVLTVVTGACANRPEVPIVPLDQEATAEVYTVTLAELKRLLTPKQGSTSPLNWSEQMYLNPVVLLPPADSATQLTHDSAWLADVISKGLVKGVCGKVPAVPCPHDVPIAFTSLSVPWRRGGDTAFVQGGYSGEIPGEKTYEGVYWVFTLAHDDEGVLKVIRKGPPNYVQFETR